MEAYCLKCRAKKEMKSAKKITMKNGKRRPGVYAPNALPSCLELEKHKLIYYSGK